MGWGAVGRGGVGVELGFAGWLGAWVVTVLGFEDGQDGSDKL